MGKGDKRKVLNFTCWRRFVNDTPRSFFARNGGAMLNPLKRRANRQTVASTIPPGLRMYAIGDVHGRADLLGALVARIDEDNRQHGPAETRMIFVGDLIDRGPASAQVLDLAIDLAKRHPATRFLLGNHEEVFLKLLHGRADALAFFLRIGGRETLLSYGISPDVIDARDEDALLAAINRHVPDHHRRFLESFEDIVIAGDYAFVHAGVRPGIALEDQKVTDLRWIREPFLDHRAPFGHIIVHGHTVTTDVDERANRIGIDTGAFASGKLTAIGLEDDKRWYLST
jgi:serine/threonine protein phosphatase 1